MTATPNDRIDFNVDKVITLNLLDEFGQGFRIDRDALGRVQIRVVDYVEGIAEIHFWWPSDTYELDDILDFTRSVAETMHCDEEVGLTYANFAQRYVLAPAMNIELEFELTNPTSNSEVQIILRFTSLMGSVLLIRTLSLDELTAAVAKIDGGVRSPRVR